MTAHCAPCTSPLYFVEVEGRIHGRYSRWFLELDRDTNCASAIRCMLRHDGSIIKILEVDEDAGTCRDVTDDMRAEALSHMVIEPREPEGLSQKWDHDRKIRTEMA